MAKSKRAKKTPPKSTDPWNQESDGQQRKLLNSKLCPLWKAGDAGVFLMHGAAPRERDTCRIQQWALSQGLQDYFSQRYCQKYSYSRIYTVSTRVILLAYYFYRSNSVSITTLVVNTIATLVYCYRSTLHGERAFISTRPCVSSNLTKIIYIHNAHALCPALNHCVIHLSGSSVKPKHCPNVRQLRSCCPRETLNIKITVMYKISTPTEHLLSLPHSAEYELWE